MAEQVDLTDDLLSYVRRTARPEPTALTALRAETALLPGGRFLQVPAEEGALLTLLVRLVRASLVVEVGTFTGCSTLCLAAGLPPAGRVITCELHDRWPAVGRPYWEQAGLADRIEVRVGDARASLAALHAELGRARVDLVFVDADKASYPDYYEAALTLVRPGGLIVLDNTLFSGRVADPTAHDPDTEAIRALNAALRADDRVDPVLLVVADGVTLVRKR